LCGANCPLQDFLRTVCDPDALMLQRDRQTDGRTTCNRNTAALWTIVHRAVSKVVYSC